MGQSEHAVVVRPHAGRRLFRPAEARHVTLREPADMAKVKEDFIVLEAGAGEDKTRSVLKCINKERARHG